MHNLNPKIFIPAVALMTLLIASLAAGLARGEDVNLAIIARIESNNNPLAYNAKSGARGLCQITEICLKDYNRLNNAKITTESLFNPKINIMVAKWYIKKQLTKYLLYYKIPLTIRNYLIAYHDGIGNLRKYLQGKRSLGKEMKGYLIKYENIHRIESM